MFYTALDNLQLQTKWWANWLLYFYILWLAVG